MADVLSSGPEPGPPVRRSGRRRWAAAVAAVAAVGVAVVLAGRSGGERVDAAPRTPSPTPAPEIGVAPPAVVSVAVGTRFAYALVAECTSQAIRACRYRLHRRDLDGTGWTRLPALRTEARGVANVFAEVWVTGGDVVTVLFGPANGRAFSSADAGATFAERPLADGPAAPRVPPAGLLNSAVFSVESRLTVLDPATGQLRLMARQPPIDGARLRSYDQRGDVVWAVGSGGEATVSAVSRDRGRSWRTLPVSGLPPGIEVLRMVAAADGGGYLLTGTLAGGSVRLTGVWRIGGAGGGWRKLPGPAPRTLRSAVAGDRGLLIVDDTGELWRLYPTGSFARLPDTVPERPGILVTGPSRVLVTVPWDRPGRTVLVSFDEGESWLAESLS